MCTLWNQHMHTSNRTCTTIIITIIAFNDNSSSSSSEKAKSTAKISMSNFRAAAAAAAKWRAERERCVTKSLIKLRCRFLSAHRFSPFFFERCPLACLSRCCCSLAHLPGMWSPHSDANIAFNDAAHSFYDKLRFFTSLLPPSSHSLLSTFPALRLLPACFDSYAHCHFPCLLLCSILNSCLRRTRSHSFSLSPLSHCANIWAYCFQLWFNCIYLILSAIAIAWQYT